MYLKRKRYFKIDKSLQKKRKIINYKCEIILINIINATTISQLITDISRECTYVYKKKAKELIIVA